MMTRGVEKGFEPAHHHDVDEDQDRGEGDPQVPKNLVGDMPFSVPFEGVLVFEPGLNRGILLQFIAFGQFELTDGLLHLQYGVNRAFLLSRHIAGHVDHPLEVFPIDRLVLYRFPDLNQFGQGNGSSRRPKSG